jgi:hypothetical protein
MPEQDVLDSINVVKIVAAVTLVGVLVLLYKAMDDAGMYGNSTKNGDGFVPGSSFAAQHTQRSDGYSTAASLLPPTRGAYSTSAEGYDVGPQYWGPSAYAQQEELEYNEGADYTRTLEKAGKLVHDGQYNKHAYEGMYHADEGMKVVPMHDSNLYSSLKGA